jgi:ribosomal protein S18 acetylase RimI-like enzyme
MAKENFTLRPVENQDAPALHAALWPGKTRRTVDRRVQSIVIRRRRGLAWGVVAEVEGQIVGYGQVSQWGQSAEISNLIVAEGWRGRGIGTAIIERLLSIIRERGYADVEIGAAVSNPRALALYRSLGFEDRRQVLMRIDGKPEPVIYLGMRLDGPPGG